MKDYKSIRAAFINECSKNTKAVAVGGIVAGTFTTAAIMATATQTAMVAGGTTGTAGAIGSTVTMKVVAASTLGKVLAATTLTGLSLFMGYKLYQTLRK